MTKFKPLKDIVITKLSSSKSFSYSKGESTLYFNLRVDTKGQLSDFLDLLEKAQGDVKLELERLNDHREPK